MDELKDKQVWLFPELIDSSWFLADNAMLEFNEVVSLESARVYRLDDQANTATYIYTMNWERLEEVFTYTYLLDNGFCSKASVLFGEWEH